MEEQQIIMNKDTEIKSIKDAQRELADRLEALETVEAAPKCQPRRGDVWADWNGARFLIDINGGMTYANGCYYTDYMSVIGSSAGECRCLGTFDEVYMLRSDVEKDYVSKEDLRPYSSNLPPSMKLAF